MRCCATGAATQLSPPRRSAKLHFRESELHEAAVGDLTLTANCNPSLRRSNLHNEMR
jgi:hypothetical protein